MTAPGRARGPVDREPFDVAVVAALVSGCLSLVAPFLVSLTAALVALAIAGWISRLRRRGTPPRSTVRGRTVLALGLLGVAVVASFALSGRLPLVCGPVLASGLVPLWWVDRHAAAFSRGGGPP